MKNRQDSRYGSNGLPAFLIPRLSRQLETSGPPVSFAILKYAKVLRNDLSRSDEIYLTSEESWKFYRIMMKCCKNIFKNILCKYVFRFCYSHANH